MPDPSHDLVALLMSRLPAGDTVSVPDVCAAWDKHRDVVEGWIDSGEVQAVDLGGGTKRSWEISKVSLERMLRRRECGLRTSADRALTNRSSQLELFN
jgi:hypothetical protein